MKKKNLLTVACFLLAQAFVAQSGSASPTATPAIAPERLKLYTVAQHTADPTCDIYLELILDHGQLLGDVATLEEQLAPTSICRYAPVPGVRFYPIQFQSESCGSLIYEGTRVDADGQHRIRITDHRPRLCDDLFPHVLVEETDPQGQTVVLYSGD